MLALTKSRFPRNLSPLKTAPSFNGAEKYQRPATRVGPAANDSWRVFKPDAAVNDNPVYRKPFPNPHRPKRPPFGKLPGFPPSLPIPTRPAFKLPLAVLPRFVPWLGGALAACDLWQLYQWYAGSYLGAPAGWTVKCSIAGDRVAHARAANLDANVCNTPGQVYANPMWPPVFEWNVGAFAVGYKDIAIGKLTNGGLRFSFDEIWISPKYATGTPQTPTPSPWQPSPAPDTPLAPPDTAGVFS